MGNVFALADIDKAIELGNATLHGHTINPYCLHVGGINFGFSTSVTTIYIGEVDTENQIVKIVSRRGI